MNAWLKIALYSLIGIVIGSFLLGFLGGNGIYMGNQNVQSNGFYHGHWMNGMMGRHMGN